MDTILREIEEFKKKGTPFKRTTWTPNDIIIKKDYAELITRDNKQNINGVVLIDVEDIDLVKNYKWRNLRGRIATTCFKNGKKESSFKLSRLIMRCEDKNLEVDHINHNIFDNRKKNLRIVTHQENQKNKTPINERKRLIIKV
jgi:hypothetical protein